MSNSSRNEFVTFLLLLITTISVFAYQKPENNNSIDYLELDLSIRNSQDKNESLEKHIDSRFKGELQGCPHKYNITKIKNHTQKNSTMNAPDKVDLTLFLTRNSPALIESCCIDFDENHLKACFEQKNKLDEPWEGASFSVKNIRISKTGNFKEDVPEELDVDLQIVQYVTWFFPSFKQDHQLENYISARFKGFLKGCRCNYIIVSIGDKKQDSASSNITLHIERDKRVPVELCSLEGSWDSQKDCLVYNNKLDDLWKGAKIFVKGVRELKLCTNPQGKCSTNGVLSFAPEPYRSIRFLIGVSLSVCCILHLVYLENQVRFKLPLEN